ncbi:hypothetical protein [Streptomyces qinglanensis]|uniref:hypothetical protein n=1 Tax=Streptomyces qinglanensis TaxID=943816 RepID=UPI003D7559FA
MARKPPQHIVIDGQPMVALTPHDFENLDAMRRQLGGQSVRMRTLRESLLETADFLEALGTALREQDSAHRLPDSPGTAALLAALPEQIRRARQTAGTVKQRRPKR